MLTNIILLLVILGFIAGGWKDGFVESFGRLIGALLGFILAQKFAHFLEPLFGTFLSDGWAKLIAFFLIFLIINRIIGFLFGLLGGVTHFLSYIPGVGLVHSFLGGVIGLFEGIIMVGGALWLLVSSKIFPSILAHLAGSSISSWIQIAFHQVLTRLPML